MTQGPFTAFIYVAWWSGGPHWSYTTPIPLPVFLQPSNTLKSSLCEFIFRSTYPVTCLLLVSAVRLLNRVRVVHFQEVCSPRTLDSHLGWRSISWKHCSSTQIYLGRLSSAQQCNLGTYCSLQWSFASMCIFQNIYHQQIYGMNVMFSIAYSGIPWYSMV